MKLRASVLREQLTEELRASVLREQLKEECDCKSGKLPDPPSVGGRGLGDWVARPDQRQPGTHHARHLRDVMRPSLSKGASHEAGVDQMKGSAA
jgi:hypothetical protein